MIVDGEENAHFRGTANAQLKSVSFLWLILREETKVDMENPAFADHFRGKPGGFFPWVFHTSVHLGIRISATCKHPATLLKELLGCASFLNHWCVAILGVAMTMFSRHRGFAAQLLGNPT